MNKIQLFVGMLAVVTGQLAYAHAELSSSVPADRATLDAAPEALTLTFTEPVRLTALAVQKVGDVKQNLGPLPSEASPTFTIAAPQLADGQYTVSWRAMSEDTHIMTGELVFGVGAGQMPPAHAQGEMGQHSDGHMDQHMEDQDGAHMEHSEVH
jgi:copper transport protein